MQMAFLVALGGALGTLARYSLSGWINSLYGGAFPLGIFIVNILGCFLFGVVWELIGIFQIVNDPARIFFLTGFMGAFTTFSTLIFDSQILYESGNWLALALNLAGQVFFGFLALRLGIRLISMLSAA